MKQEIVLGCMPCLDSIAMGLLPYKDSTVAICSKCGIKVWLGPKQKEVSEKQKCDIVCLLCLYLEHGPDVVNQLKPLTNKRMGE